MSEPRGPAARPGPGLPRLPLTVDTQPGFLEQMSRRIASRPELAGLTTREVDDASVGLLDAAATLLDVLAFYGEAIGNEGYLRTATERRSVLELARAIDYELAPGVAASTVLAFEVDPPPGASPDVVIRAGTPAQKLPGEDQVSAVYETSHDLVARKPLNVLRPVVVEPARPVFGDTEVVLAGLGLGLSVGDLLLLVGDERLADSGSEAWDVRTLVAVDEQPADTGAGSDGAPSRTVVTLDRPLGHVSPHVDPAAAGPRCFHLTVTATLFGSTAPRYSDLPVSLRVGEPNPNPGRTGPAFLTGPYAGDADAWVDDPLPAGTTALWLDRIHRTVTVGSWLVLSRPGYSELYRVTSAEHGNRNAYLMSGPSTKVGISGEHTDFFSIRSAAVLTGSRELPLGTQPVTAAVQGTSLLLDTPVELEPGRLVTVEGVDADSGGAASEAAEVEHADVDAAAGTTLVTLRTSLVHRYRAQGLRVRGNAVRATHGQTVRTQPVGSGDASRDFLTLPLAVGAPAPGPLTYTAADTPSGRETSLVLRVDGVAWQQVDSLAGQPPDARVFVVRHGEHSCASVVFGDGRTGARPASGRDNLTAGYRLGLGLAGHAVPGQITLPLGLPLGTRAVTNPVAALGGEDPETLETARVNAPTTIRALGRIVSVRDLEDFARTFAGIGWASVSELDDGLRRVLHLTVTLADGTPLPPGSDTESRLREAIEAARHSDRPVVVAGHLPRVVDVQARVVVATDRVAADVLAAGRAAVLALLDPAPSLGRGGGFGALLAPTRVLAALQTTPGVVGAVLGRLRAVDDADPAGPEVTVVQARAARVLGGSLRAAEMLQPGTVEVVEEGVAL